MLNNSNRPVPELDFAEPTTQKSVPYVNGLRPVAIDSEAHAGNCVVSSSVCQEDYDIFAQWTDGAFRNFGH